MLREEQIGLRRERAKAEPVEIENVGQNRVFSDFRVTNRKTGGCYTVVIRSLEGDDNSCTCPDFRTNNLGTCKHVEAVLEHLTRKSSPGTKKKRAIITRPEIDLHYPGGVRLRLRLPTRHSDKLTRLAQRFFDDKGLWNGRESYAELISAVESVPEAVTFSSGVLDFIDRESERIEFAKLERQWLADLEASRLDWQLLPTRLYDYQTRGAIFLACRGRAILGDDMGLGKTVQTLAAVEILSRERGLRRVLVIAPASVKYQWETEIRRFTPRAVQVIDGSPEVRKQQYAETTFYRLVNYEQVVSDSAALQGWQPDLIVLDEAQRIKNWQAKTGQMVKKLESRYAFVLTGTPLENKLEELYSIVSFVDPHLLGPAYEFLQEHVARDQAGNTVGYRNLESIRQKLQPIFLRRTRAEVLEQLPPRTDNVVFVGLSDGQLGPYEEQRNALAALLRKGFLTDIDRKRILACLANLRMICDSTFLYDRETNHSPKLDELAVMIPELTTGGHKVVVFSQWETMLAKSAELFDRLQIGYVLLHGKLPGKERKAVMERFQTDPECVAFLSTDAGGTGLNLQAADTVINLELPWNPAVLEQRIARVHRMGQKKPVRVVNLATANTVEERVLKTLSVKQELFTTLFDGEADEIQIVVGREQQFLNTVRQLIDEPGIEPNDVEGERDGRPEKPSVTATMLPTDMSTEAVWQAGTQLIAALANWVRQHPQSLPHSTEFRQSLAELLAALPEQDAESD